MKRLFILFIVYHLQVQTIFGRQLEGREKEIMQECAQELNVDGEKYLSAIQIQAYKKNPDEETSGMLACGFRKIFSEALFGKGKDVKLHEGLIKLVDTAYDAGFGKEYPEIHQEDLVNKIEKCHATAKTEGELFNCVGVFESPILNMIALLK